MATATPPDASIWVDGSATDPADPALRRAAWAGVWQEGAHWRTAAGHTAGRQTAGRAEVAALIWATGNLGPRGTVVTDCEYALKGASAIQAGAGAEYLTGMDGDLWRLYRPHQGTMRWVKAHLTRDEAQRRGFQLADWEGNARADEAAKAAATQRREAPAVLAKRHSTLSALRAAQRVIAVVTEAALAADEQRETRPRRKAKRRQLNRRLFVRPNQPRAHARTRPRALPDAQPEARPSLPEHPALHTIRVADGPPPNPAAHSTRRGTHHTALCVKCGKAWTHTAKWRSIAHETCPAGGEAVRGWEVTTHQHALVKQEGGWRCLRCDLWVQPRHRALQAGRKCPVPVLQRPNGTMDDTATGHLRNLVNLLPDWEAQHYGRKTGADGRKRPNPTPAAAAGAPEAARPRLDAPAQPPPPRAIRWLPHLAVAYSARRGEACLRCGATAPATDPRRLRGTSCGGESATLPAKVRRELLAGLFDAALAEASAEAVNRARFAGWRPLHQPLEQLSGRGGRGAVD